MLAQTLPDGVPGWVNIAASAVGLAVAVYLWMSSQLKPLPKATGSVIIPEMSIADSQAIRHLALELQNWASDRRQDLNTQAAILVELRTMNAVQDQVRETIRENTRANTEVFRAILDRLPTRVV